MQLVYRLALLLEHLQSLQKHALINSSCRRGWSRCDCGARNYCGKVRWDINPSSRDRRDRRVITCVDTLIARMGITERLSVMWAAGACPENCVEMITQITSVYLITSSLLCLYRAGPRIPARSAAMQ